jgi:hypothetical protein
LKEAEAELQRIAAETPRSNSSGKVADIIVDDLVIVATIANAKNVKNEVDNSATIVKDAFIIDAAIVSDEIASAAATVNDEIVHVATTNDGWVDLQC